MNYCITSLIKSDFHTKKCILLSVSYSPMCKVHHRCVCLCAQSVNRHLCGVYIRWTVSGGCCWEEGNQTFVSTSLDTASSAVSCEPLHICVSDSTLCLSLLNVKFIYCTDHLVYRLIFSVTK